jgi:uncharacterized membrane protein SpoIIM required for sporulation
VPGTGPPGYGDGVDLDAFVAVHGDQWDELDRLTRRRRLSAAEVDELIGLYRLTATHLSAVQSTSPDPALAQRLSVLLNRARHAVTASTSSPWDTLVRFATVDFPAALFRIRRWVLWVVVGSLVLALAAGLWVGLDESTRNALIDPAQARLLTDHQFRQYYFEYDSASFAAQVTTNNAWIVVQCVVFGITGFWPLLVTGTNMLNVGVQGGVMAAYGGLDTFFVYILPHGMLELTAIFTACAAGLRLFWAWVSPGADTRAASLAREGRILATVAIGLVGVLVVSGLIEGFVTPSALPAAVRIGIGAVALLAFLHLMLVRGRDVTRRGATGDLDEDTIGAADPVAG